MLLGYSLLQLLEYCVAVIMTQIERFHEFLSRNIADRKGATHSRLQSMDNNQDTAHNDKKDSHVIELDQEAIRIGIDWEEKFKIMEQEMRQIKKEWKDMKTENNMTGRFASTN